MRFVLFNQCTRKVSFDIVMASLRLVYLALWIRRETVTVTAAQFFEFEDCLLWLSLLPGSKRLLLRLIAKLPLRC